MTVSIPDQPLQPLRTVGTTSLPARRVSALVSVAPALLPLLLMGAMLGELPSGPAIASASERAALPAPGDPAAGRRLSLDDAIAELLQSNPGLLAGRAGEGEATAGLGKARARLLPMVDVTQVGMWTNDPVGVFGSKLRQGGFEQSDFAIRSLNEPDGVTDFATALNLRIPVWQGGMEHAGVAMAREGTRSARLAVEFMEQDLVFQLTRAFFGVLLSEAAEETAAAAVTTTETNLQMIQTRFDEGLVLKPDLLSTQVRLADQWDQLTRARTRTRLALAGFNLLLGNPEQPARPHGSLEQPLSAMPQEAEQVAIALDRRKDLRQMDSAWAMAQRELQMARRDSLPKVNGFTTVEYHGENPFSDGQDMITAGLNVTVPVYAGGVRRHQVEEVQSRLARLEFQRQALRQQVELQVVEAVAQYREAVDRVTLSGQTVEMAEETLAMVTSHYQEGVATLATLQNAEFDLTRARLNRLQALYDLVMSQATLAHVTGTGRLSNELQAE